MAFPAITVALTITVALAALARRGDVAFVGVMLAGIAFCVAMHLLTER